MEWQQIARQINSFKEKFEKSYKCVNKDTVIKVDTLIHHTTILTTEYNNISELVSTYKHKLTDAHNEKCLKLLRSLVTRLEYVSARHNFKLQITKNLYFPIEFDPSQFNDLDESKPIIEYEDSAESDIETLEDKPSINTMAQTVVDFLKTASSLLSEYDGKAENLQSFKDALSLVDTIKGEHEATAIQLIKTKLKGHARNLISNEQTIAQIIAKLSSTVKGESVEVLSAKLLNLQQRSKTANQYTQEVEQLTKALEGAFISDGLTPELANKYSTTQAVKAMTKNCSIDKVKLIMQAGTFSNMNDAISKFVNSCTEATGQSNSVLHFHQRQTNYRGNRGNYRGRGNYQNNSYQNYNRNYNRGQGQNRGNSRGRGNPNRGNYNNVRVTQSTSENSMTPSDTSQ